MADLPSTPAEIENPNDYYVIEAQALEWVETIGSLIKGFPKDALGAVYIMPDRTGMFVIYWIEKEYLSAEALAAAIGQTPDAVRAAKLIRLAPLGKDPKRPTVAYYGHA